MTRIPVAMAGLALVAVTAVACGSDDGDDTTASDTSTSSATTSPSVSDSPTASDSSLPPGPTPESGDPVPSPIINKAVKAAIADHFAALVPAGVPAGWTVVKATYSPKHGGQWRIELTDPNGADVTLVQSTSSAIEIVEQNLPDAQPAGTVDLSNFGTGMWDAYSGTSTAGLAKELSGSAAVVIGPSLDTVTELAQELLTAEDGGHGDGG
jgi:Protein of unknown function (DUF4245)